MKFLTVVVLLTLTLHSSGNSIGFYGGLKWDQCVCFKETVLSMKCDDKVTLQDDIGNKVCNFTTDWFVSLQKLELSGSYISSHSFIRETAVNLQSLSITNSFESSLLLKDFAGLNALTFLNLSGNAISSFDISGDHVFPKLTILDLSSNHLSTVTIKQAKSFPSLQQLFLQNNSIRDYNVVPNLSVNRIDLSSNPLNSIFKRSQSFFNDQLYELHLNNVSVIDSINQGKFKPSKPWTKNDRQFFPASLKYISLQNNSLKKIPLCLGLFKSLGLENVDLSYNQISIVGTGADDFECYSSLKSLNLSNNKIVEVDPSMMKDFPSLESLQLHDNFLQNLPLELLKHFIESNQTLNYEDNPFTCDCNMKELRNYLRNQTTGNIQVMCHKPFTAELVSLKATSMDDLICEAPVNLSSNSSKTYEWADGVLSCSFGGFPKPLVHWVTPSNQTVSFRSLARGGEKLEDFSLSAFGSELTIKNMKIYKTGHYRCVAENSAGTSNQTVTIGVIPSSQSTIIVVAVACLSFIVAIIINFVNLTLYILDHLKKQKYKRVMRAAAAEQDKSTELLVKSVPKPLRKSAVSLGCISQHEKYDNTCQQMFLDTMVKGAHSVKKTISDARHSDFSANMMGYASSLRDRMHIEMPSTSFQIPTMQNINSNIEKLSSSMVTKSQNIATSVGSVLTLKRWTHQHSTEVESEVETDIDKKSEKSSCENMSIKKEEVAVEFHEPITNLVLVVNPDDATEDNNTTADNIVEEPEAPTTAAESQQGDSNDESQQPCTSNAIISSHTDTDELIEVQTSHPNDETTL